MATAAYAAAAATTSNSHSRAQKIKSYISFEV
jgi:hypothetical protein